MKVIEREVQQFLEEEKRKNFVMGKYILERKYCRSTATTFCGGILRMSLSDCL